MIVIRGKAANRPSDKREATFTGEVWADSILPGVDDVTIATVFFPPGTRTFWHRHERGQILQVVSGTGYVCALGGTPELLRAGDTVWTPPGEAHWHGATLTSFMSHTAISIGTTTWADEVDQAAYVIANESPMES